MLRSIKQLRTLLGRFIFVPRFLGQLFHFRHQRKRADLRFFLLLFKQLAHFLEHQFLGYLLLILFVFLLAEIDFILLLDDSHQQRPNPFLGFFPVDCGG